jgi:hypothetical protein
MWENDEQAQIRIKNCFVKHPKYGPVFVEDIKRGKALLKLIFPYVEPIQTDKPSSTRPKFSSTFVEVSASVLDDWSISFPDNKPTVKVVPWSELDHRGLYTGYFNNQYDSKSYWSERSSLRTTKAGLSPDNFSIKDMKTSFLSLTENKGFGQMLMQEVYMPCEAALYQLRDNKYSGSVAISRLVSVVGEEGFPLFLYYKNRRIAWSPNRTDFYLPDQCSHLYETLEENGVNVRRSVS